MKQAGKESRVRFFGFKMYMFLNVAQKRLEFSLQIREFLSSCNAGLMIQETMRSPSSHSSNLSSRLRVQACKQYLHTGQWEDQIAKTSHSFKPLFTFHGLSPKEVHHLWIFQMALFCLPKFSL